jgi:hypothetical protein
MEEDTHSLPFGFDFRNVDGVWRSIYLGDASLARSIFNPANERDFCLHRAKCTRGTSAHSLARRGYFGVFWGIWVGVPSFWLCPFGSEDSSERSYPGPAGYHTKSQGRQHQIISLETGWKCG